MSKKLELVFINAEMKVGSSSIEINDEELERIISKEIYDEDGLYNQKHRANITISIETVDSNKCVVNTFKLTEEPAPEAEQEEEE